jgi:glycosyltransferase involved in cell wall biosynthesis
MIDQQPYIIIPVFNHDAQLAAVINGLQERGYANIIVVNDGSVTDIWSIVSSKNIIYLEHCINLGQGAALQTGFTYALARGADIAVSFDADGQHDPDDIPQLLAPIINGKADIVCGSRFINSGGASIPLSRRVIIRAARIINYLFTGIMLTDAHNGLRAMNEKTIKTIRLSENRMAHATEILFEIKKHGLRIKEVPVNIQYTNYSMQYGQSSWNSIKIFFDILFYKLFT